MLSRFIHEITWVDLPEVVRRQARRCLLDTLGAAIGGRGTPLSQIVHDFASVVYGGDEAQLWLDGRTVSAPGAALANGMTIDALDIHDGYTMTKGHAGAAIIPAALATVSDNDYAKGVDGRELFVRLVVGYEVALRAGLALHATACDYHTSGAWNALGCAALTARRLGLDSAQTGHALGIAEYHGPRSQMMRCIDHPTMLKDGSGWGAMAGVSAALLAKNGFSGAPALTVEGDEAGEFWSDLGSNWLITQQYFKPYAVCRWAQPAIAGALALRENLAVRPEQIKQLRVMTFHEAVRLSVRRPLTTEEAQYSLPFPVAAALVHNHLGPAELSGAGLKDVQVLELADRVELIEDPTLSARFPAERYARVQIETFDGQLIDSGEIEATWGEAEPPTDGELRDKFRWLARTNLPESRARALEEAIWHCDTSTDAAEILALLAPPAEEKFGLSTR
jgi:2-methylcitrate dehydratase PrpD